MRTLRRGGMLHNYHNEGPKKNTAGNKVIFCYMCTGKGNTAEQLLRAPCCE